MLGFFQLGKLAEDDEAIAQVFHGRTAGVRRTLRRLIRDAVERGEFDADYDTSYIVEGVLGIVWAMASGAAQAGNADTRRQLELAVDGLFREPVWATPAPVARPGPVRANARPRTARKQRSDA